MTWICVELSVCARTILHSKWMSVCVFIYCAPNNLLRYVCSCRCMAFIHTILNVFTFASIVFVVVVTEFVYYFLGTEWDGTFDWAHLFFFLFVTFPCVMIYASKWTLIQFKMKDFFFLISIFYNLTSHDVRLSMTQNKYSKNICYESTRNW